jgi:hypothetical protein
VTGNTGAVRGDMQESNPRADGGNLARDGFCNCAPRWRRKRRRRRRRSWGERWIVNVDDNNNDNVDKIGGRGWRSSWMESNIQ